MPLGPCSGDVVGNGGCVFVVDERLHLIAPRLVPGGADVVGDGEVFIVGVFRPEICAPPPNQCVDANSECRRLESVESAPAITD